VYVLVTSACNIKIFCHPNLGFIKSDMLLVAHNISLQVVYIHPTDDLEDRTRSVLRLLNRCQCMVRY